MQLQYANLGNNWKQSYTNSEDREAGRRVEAWIAAKGEVTVSPFQVACIHKLRWNVKMENHCTFGQGKDFEFLFWSVDIIHLQFATSTVCLFSQCRLEVQCAPPLLRREDLHRSRFCKLKWNPRKLATVFNSCQYDRHSVFTAANQVLLKIHLWWKSVSLICHLIWMLALLVRNDSTGGVFNFEFVFFMIPK